MLRRKRLLTTSIVSILVALSILDHNGVFGYRGDDRARYRGIHATITYVSDGDTLDIDVPDGKKSVTRLRLWGVDCPEVAHAKEESDAYFGREAADFVQEHYTGRRVRLELDPNHNVRDKYGRLLAYVYSESDGEMLNELLVTEGLAYADRRFDHALKHRFVELEKKAAKAKMGLWAEVKPEQMPAWRQRMDAAGAR